MSQIKYFPFKLNDLIIIKRIVTIHYQEIDFDYLSKGEKHNFFELMYVDKNTIDITINNKDTHTLNEGEAIFIKPNDFHSIKCNKDTNVFIISFECISPSMSYFNSRIVKIDSSSLVYLMNIINEAKNTFIIPKFDPNITKMELKENPTLGSQQLIKNNLEIFLIYLLRNEQNKKDPELLFYSKTDLSIEELILKFLKENIYNKIDLDMISKSLHVSKSYLCSLFKNKYNTSIMNYFNFLKIEEAKELLKKNKSIKEISELLNYNDNAHFINTFKKYTNTTPSKYKTRLVK